MLVHRLHSFLLLCPDHRASGWCTRGHHTAHRADQSTSTMYEYVVMLAARAAGCPLARSAPATHGTCRRGIPAGCLLHSRRRGVGWSEAARVDSTRTPRRARACRSAGAPVGRCAAGAAVRKPREAGRSGGVSTCAQEKTWRWGTRGSTHRTRGALRTAITYLCGVLRMRPERAPTDGAR